MASLRTHPYNKSLPPVLLCFFMVGISHTHTKDETVSDWRRVGRGELFRAINAHRYTNTNLARNIILFIGDGMGMSTVTAARIYEGQSRGHSGEENLLFFERFPHVGIMKTYNADAQVPDSAATGTAILSGVKVNSGVIGCDSQVKKANCSTFSEDRKLPTILQHFVNEGLSTGIVSNSRITHATPASAYAHTPFRAWEGDVDMEADRDEDEECSRVDDIAMQLVRNNRNIKVLLGGGRRYFLDNSTLDPETGQIDPYQRRDGNNLINEWIQDKQDRNLSHRYVWNARGLQTVNPDNTEYLLGLFDPSHMDFDMFPANRRGSHSDPSLSLADLTEKAIRVLSKDRNGYFLLVEGARIDWGHHANSATIAMQETVELDRAVKRAVRMVDRRETLVLVTADHSHAFTIQGYSPRGHDILGLSQPDPKHEPLDGLPYTTLAYTNGPQFGREDLSGVNTAASDFRQSACVPLSVESHAGEDVGAYARGPWAHLLHTTHEQNYLYHVMEYAACMGWSKQYCREGERFQSHAGGAGGSGKGQGNP